MMTPEEEKQIRTWNNGLSCDIRIILLVTEDKRSENFLDFCQNLTRLAPRIGVTHQEAEPNEAPVIQIGDALRYHAIPLGTELGPFLEALSPSDKNATSISDSVRYQLEEIELPVLVKLYVSQNCPFCPVTVRHITALLGTSEFIRLTVIDCALFPEMASSDRIQSVPTLLLDGGYRWTGQFQLEEVVEVIVNHDPAKLGTLSLERMLKEGNAARLAEMMLDKEDIFPAFVDLLVHKKWPVRLGAMVAMEEITSRNPELAARVTDPLWKYFEHVGDPVKGDIIHVLGESGHQAIAPRVEQILRGEYDPEIKEAAREALDKIADRKEPVC